MRNRIESEAEIESEIFKSSIFLFSFLSLSIIHPRHHLPPPPPLFPHHKQQPTAPLPPPLFSQTPPHHDHLSIETPLSFTHLPPSFSTSTYRSLSLIFLFFFSKSSTSRNNLILREMSIRVSFGFRFLKKYPWRE